MISLTPSRTKTAAAALLLAALLSLDIDRAVCPPAASRAAVSADAPTRLRILPLGPDKPQASRRALS